MSGMDEGPRYVTPEAIARGVALPPGEYRLTGDAGVRVPIVAAPNLAEFLLARFGEDEEASDEIHNVYDCDRTHGFTCDCPVPGKLLAECEAKQRVVRFLEQEMDDIGDVPDPNVFTQGVVEGLHRAVILLAQPYADHPDFRDEWRL